MTKLSKRSLIGVIIAAVAATGILIPTLHEAQAIVVNQNANQSVNITVQGSSKMNNNEIRLTQIVKQRSDIIADDKGRHSGDFNEKSYTLAATGFATEKPSDSNGDLGYSAISSDLRLNLTEIAATKNLSVLKVNGGTIKIGPVSYRIEGAIATFNNVNHKLNVIAVVAGNNGQNNNSFDSDMIGLVKIYATTSADGKLPVTKSDPAMKITIESPQSEIIPADLFLKMTGEVKLA